MKRLSVAPPNNYHSRIGKWSSNIVFLFIFCCLFQAVSPNLKRWWYNISYIVIPSVLKIHVTLETPNFHKFCSFRTSWTTQSLQYHENLNICHFHRIRTKTHNISKRRHDHPYDFATWFNHPYNGQNSAQQTFFPEHVYYDCVVVVNTCSHFELNTNFNVILFLYKQKSKKTHSNFLFYIPLLLCILFCFLHSTANKKQDEEPVKFLVHI